MLFHVKVIGRGLVPNPQNEGDPDPILDLEVTTYTDPGKLIFPLYSMDWCAA